jgi:hypothetical protein
MALGLKLQGQIGKFGNVELSDISAFVEMPDGKVIAGMPFICKYCVIRSEIDATSQPL